MLRRIEDNKGFCIDLICKSKNPLKIGIIDADLLDHGTQHPNLALLKISGFCKGITLDKGQHHDVRLICSYDEIEGLMSTINEYDIIAVSQVFKFTKRPAILDRLIDDHLVYYGGTGFFEINGPNLPEEVEHHKPDYSLYNEYIEIQTRGDEKRKREILTII